MSPIAGRFLSRDPIGYFGGAGLQEYVGNGPLDRFDPSGNATISVKINAFISKLHDSDRDGWIPFLPWNNTPMQVTTNRRWGGEDGTSKIKKKIEAPSCNLSKISHTPASSDGTQIRFWHGSHWSDPVNYPVTPVDSSGVLAKGKCKSTWSGGIEAAIANWWVLPPIRLSGEVDFTGGVDVVTVDYKLQVSFFPDFEVIVEADGKRCGVNIHYQEYMTHPFWGLYSHSAFVGSIKGSIKCNAITDCDCGGSCTKKR